MNIEQVRKDEMNKSKNIFDFIEGQQLFRNNKDCPEDASDDMKRGYEVEYGLCEMRSQGLFN